MSVHGSARSLGAVGIWAPWWLWKQEGEKLDEAARELEELGFGTLWVANGPEMLETAAVMLGATTAVSIATGIVNIWVHDPADVADAYLQAEQRFPGRLTIGLGNGPREPAQWARSPYRELTRYLDRLDDVGLSSDGRMLAAVGPRMLELAAARSLGAHPFLSTPEHTALARAALGNGPLLAPELKVVLETDPAVARSIARQALTFYLTKRGYAANLRRLGFTDEDLQGGGSDRLVDAVVAWGDVHTVLDRISEHQQAGADHVAVQLLDRFTDGPDRAVRRLPRAGYRQLAAGLAG
ncbi:TIGR03620 family F420-dependent LLM class oxidoreductase [Kribbella sp. NPDC056951]|uniref:TIGR03620 family F420-dependent LLM class oxidoreductase n=1 Tax=Kribbella sp. NPDC056951 TaxID=3345978 RepID=UPI00364347FF